MWPARGCAQQAAAAIARGALAAALEARRTAALWLPVGGAAVAAVERALDVELRQRTFVALQYTARRGG